MGMSIEPQKASRRCPENVHEFAMDRWIRQDCYIQYVVESWAGKSPKSSSHALRTFLRCPKEYEQPFLGRL